MSDWEPRPRGWWPARPVRNGGGVGTTLGVGGNIGWNSKVDVNASTAYAYELASAAWRFDALRASQLDHDAKTSGNEPAQPPGGQPAIAHRPPRNWMLNSAGVSRSRRWTGLPPATAQAAAGLAAQMALVGNGRGPQPRHQDHGAESTRMTARRSRAGVQARRSAAAPERLGLVDRRALVVQESQNTAHNPIPPWAWARHPRNSISPSLRRA